MKEKKLHKITELAEQIGIEPEELFRELVKRGQGYIAVDREVDSHMAEAILNEHKKKPGKIDFDIVAKSGIVPEFTQKDSVAVNQFKPNLGKKFEIQVGALISHYFPNSHLSSVFLYIAKLLTDDENKFGREMDHLMHIKDDNVNRLLIIECKAQEIKPDAKTKRWLASYDSGPKDVKRQMKMQAKAVHQMIKPVPDMNLEINCVAVSSSKVEQGLTHQYDEQGVPVILEVMSIEDFRDLMDDYNSSSHVHVLRIFQSELLRRLRQGKPCEHQGHPDIRDAIEYHKRVRLTMDWALFDHFKPTIGKWAINGTAGMGKTVLLAYSACVLSCDHELKYDEGTGSHRLEKFNGKQKNIPHWKDRKIIVYAIQPKQVSVIGKFFDLFQRLFEENDNTYQISRFRSVDFKVWENKTLEGNVVLIDEAHDLCSESQARISEWCKENKYLVIACDRHQKLRLTEEGDQERMISGLDFSGCSKKLSRIYRNPFSVYAAGLSLMFRWFSADGPKVIPPVERLTDSFGFNVKRRDLRAGMGCLFEMVEDAHPANNWHQCVSSFPDAETAYNWFQQYKIESDDVLWVRFSSEDRTFDYPKLRNSFEYHDLELKAARAERIDKYIKGQEFSVVVIEGVGADFDNMDDVAAMLEHRRELYLCSSRATLFLFFILNKDCDEIILKEFEDLRTALSKPLRPSDATQFWGLKFDANQNKTISFSEYQDIVDPIVKSRPEPKPKPELEPKTEPEPGAEPEMKEPKSDSEPELRSDEEIKSEESGPNSEEDTVRNLDSETDTETPQDLETVTEHKTVIVEDPQLATALEREQDSKSVNTSDVSQLKNKPGPGINESDAGVKFKEKSGIISITQDEITHDPGNLSHQELSNLRDKLEKMSKYGGISIDFKGKNLSINLSKPDKQSTSELDSELVVYNRKELGELNGLKGQILKKAHKLYLEIISLINSKTFTIENKELISNSKLIVQKSLLHPEKVGVSVLMQRKIRELSNPEFDKIKSMVRKFTDVLQFPINSKVFIRELQTMILIVCFPADALTMKLSSNSLGFAFSYLKYILDLSPDNVSSKGKELMVLRNNLFDFLSKHPLISVNLLALKRELTSSLPVQKQIKKEFPQKDKKTVVPTKTKKPVSENKQNPKSITMYYKEIDRNELASKLGVSYSKLMEAKEELGEVWPNVKLDYYKAKRICSKFGYEIIDKSPKDDF